MLLSRRTALLGTAAVATCAAPVAMAEYLNRDTDPVVVLERQWKDTLEESSRMFAFYCRQADKMPAWTQPGEDQFGGGKWGWPDVGDLPEFRTACAGRGLSRRPALLDVRTYNKDIEDRASGDEDRAKRRAEGRARVRAWEVRYREREALERELGINDWDEQTDPVHDRLWALQGQMAETPAQSFAGVAAKLRLHVHDECDDTELALSALRDVERLSGEAQS